MTIVSNKVMEDTLLREFFLYADKIRQKNQSLIKRKLSLYRDLKMYQDQHTYKIPEELFEIIERQEILLKKARSFVIEETGTNIVRELENAINKQKELSPELKSIVGSVKPMLDSTILCIDSQRSVLKNTKYSYEEKIELYKKYFKDELAEYKKYEELAKGIVNQTNIMKSKFQEIQQLKSEEFYRISAVRLLVAVAACSFFLNGDLEKILIGTAATFVTLVGTKITKGVIKMKKLHDALKNINAI